MDTLSPMLRIIAGEFRSRLLETPPDARTTRPLPDRVRVALFSMLQGHLEGEVVVDVFAGTGSFGLEAISRGAEHAYFIERDRGALTMLRRNIDALGVAERCTVIPGDALGPAALGVIPERVHVVMMDPPYPMLEEPTTRAPILEQFARFVERLDETGYAIWRSPWPFVEHVGDEADPAERRRVEIPLEIPGAEGPETHSYGSTAVHWYMRQRGGA